ncbi:MAG: RDD family protein [Microbacteriaceae bacterium]|nr:RDD family protein [Microbacteriaceae bacterium]
MSNSSEQSAGNISDVNFREINELPVKARIKEICIDYLVILAYLLLLFAVSMGVYSLLFRGIPSIGELETQLISAFLSVIPIILIFSYLDYAKSGSIGKRIAGLKLVYKRKSVQASLIRNIIKFLPWQLGHTSAIHGIYSGYDGIAVALSVASMALAFVLICMIFFRKDKRHLGDILAKTRVQCQK